MNQSERIRQLEQRARDADARERREDERDIRAKLTAMGITDEVKRESAFRVFKDDLKRDKDGNLVAGPDGEPYDEYIEKQLTTVYPFLLPEKQPSVAGGAKEVVGIDINTIKFGMKPEHRSKVQAEIARVIKERA